MHNVLAELWTHEGHIRTAVVCASGLVMSFERIDGVLIGSHTHVDKTALTTAERRLVAVSRTWSDVPDHLVTVTRAAEKFTQHAS